MPLLLFTGMYGFLANSQPVNDMWSCHDPKKRVAGMTERCNRHYWPAIEMDSHAPGWCVVQNRMTQRCARARAKIRTDQLWAALRHVSRGAAVLYGDPSLDALRLAVNF